MLAEEPAGKGERSREWRQSVILARRPLAEGWRDMGTGTSSGPASGCGNSSSFLKSQFPHFKNNGVGPGFRSPNFSDIRITQDEFVGSADSYPSTDE